MKSWETPHERTPLDLHVSFVYNVDCPRPPYKKEEPLWLIWHTVHTHKNGTGECTPIYTLKGEHHSIIVSF